MATKQEAILLRIGADVSSLRKELSSGTNAVNAFTKDIDLSRNTLVKFAGTIAAGIGLAALAREALQFADNVKKVADQTGLTTDEVQRLQFIASQTGVSIDSLAGTISKMQRTLSDAGDDGQKARKAISDLGLDVEKVLAMKPEDQFQLIAEEISKIPNPANQAAAAMEVFGKSGADALPMLKSMAEQGQELSAQFDAIGGPASQAAIDKVDAIGDSLTATGIAAKATTTELLAMVAEPVIAGLTKLQELLGGIRVLLGKGADEGVNLTMQIDALTEEINSLEHSRGIMTGSVQASVKALKEERQALIDQQEAMLGVGKAGMQAKVEMQQWGEVVLEMPVLTAQALGETDRLLDEAVARQIAREEAARQRLMDENALRLELINKGVGDIEEVQGAHFSKMEEFSMKSWDSQVSIVAGSLQEMTAGIAQHSKTAFEVNKLAAIANAVVNTVQAVTRAWADYGWPWGAVIGAAIAAAGVGQINAIRNTKYNGGGSGVPPSGATTPPVNTASAGGGGGGGQGGGGVLRVEGLSGTALLDGKTVRALAEKLVEHQKNGGQVVFS